MEKIIVPTDFSNTAAGALRYGQFLARSLGYELEVVHVHDGYGHCDDPTIHKNDLTAKMSIQNKLDEFLRFAIAPTSFKEAPATATPPPINTKEITGSPGEAILQLGDGDNVALIVMGGVGTGKVGANSPVFGSVAKSVALNAKVPVVLIPQGFESCKIETVAIAFDDLAPLQEISDKADFLIGNRDPAVRLVHVEHQDPIRESLKKTDLLKSALKSEFPKYSVNLDLLPSGDLANALSAYVKEFDIDLLIMGHRKRGLFSRLFVRSGVSPVLDVAPVPILVVPIRNY